MRSELKSDLEDMDSRVRDLESEVEELRQLVLETSPVQADLSDKERELVALWVQEPIWRTIEDICGELDIGESYARNLMTGIREELEFEDKQIDDFGKKAFRLAESERNRITN